MIELRYDEDIDIKNIWALYEDAGWIAYTDNLDKLKAAFQSSLKVISAWDGNRLVGLIRAVGDGLTIIYIQDILVLRAYQDMGIGSKLVNAMDECYKDVRQKVLLCDDEGRTVKFYKKLGFKEAGQYSCIAFCRYKA